MNEPRTSGRRDLKNVLDRLRVTTDESFPWISTREAKDIVRELRVARAALEDIQGNVYLWRLGEIDAETAVTAIRDVLEPTCV